MNTTAQPGPLARALAPSFGSLTAAVALALMLLPAHSPATGAVVSKGKPTLVNTSAPSTIVPTGAISTVTVGSVTLNNNSTHASGGVSQPVTGASTANSPTPVISFTAPEPSSVLLLTSASLGLVGFCRRRA